MLFTDCPFCNAPALVDETSDTLVCEPCAMALPLDADPTPVELPIAA